MAPRIVLRFLLPPLLLVCLLGTTCADRPAGHTTEHYPVVILGGGASGTAAAVAAARQGSRVLLVEAGPWLGGMLTAAGVSASDGNHEVASGIWAEFRDSLRRHYGGAEALATGWVSHTLFEPRIGQRILRNMVANEPNIELRLNTGWSGIETTEKGFFLATSAGAKQVSADVLVDATELGDVAAALGVPYDVGMEARSASGESFAPEAGNDIIQDLTYVATLRDFGPGNAPRLPEPPGYDPSAFACACDTADPSGDGRPRIDCRKMLDYGRLPGNRYMINWPNCGNDYYANPIDASPAERGRLYAGAKAHTRRFVYYLQHDLGFDHLGLDPDEYPTADGLPLLPYHRESRRIHGLVRFNVHDLTDPYGQDDPLYRTSIATGDYPIDHHHKMRPDAPDIDFIRIKAPAYGLPLGTLIPESVDGLIVAEKSISVSNIVNGTTRLQPVVLGIGQAAGILAALAARRGGSPREVPVREVQFELLRQGAALLPFHDVPVGHPRFGAVQSVAVTGILRGTGEPYKWANRLWFYPDEPVTERELVAGLRDFYPDYRPAPGFTPSDNLVNPVTFGEILATVPGFQVPSRAPAARAPLSRAEIAELLQATWNPFAEPIDHRGHRLSTPE